MVIIHGFILGEYFTGHGGLHEHHLQVFLWLEYHKEERVENL